MTDKERFIALMADFGVGFTEEVSETETSLIMEAHFSSKVWGYAGFQCWHMFDEHGKFIRILINE